MALSDLYPQSGSPWLPSVPDPLPASPVFPTGLPPGFQEEYEQAAGIIRAKLSTVGVCISPSTGALTCDLLVGERDSLGRIPVSVFNGEIVATVVFPSPGAPDESGQFPFWAPPGGDGFAPNPSFSGGGGGDGGPGAACLLARQLTNFPDSPKVNGTVSAISVNLPASGILEVLSFPLVGAPSAKLAYDQIVFDINSTTQFRPEATPIPDLVSGSATYNAIIGALDVDLRIIGSGQDVGRITRRFTWEANAFATCGAPIGGSDVVTFSLLGDNQGGIQGCACAQELTGIKDAVNRLADRVIEVERVIDRIPNIMVRALPPITFYPFVYRNLMRAIQGGLSNVVKAFELFLKIIVFREGDDFQNSTLTDSTVEIPDSDLRIRTIDENAPIGGIQEPFAQDALTLSLSTVELPPRPDLVEGLVEAATPFCVVRVTGASANLREQIFDRDLSIIRFGSIAFVDSQGSRGDLLYVGATRQVFFSNIPDAIGVVEFPQIGVTFDAQFFQ